MTLVTRTQRVTLDAATTASLTRGTLTPPSGARHDFHGWLRRAELILSRRLKHRSAGYCTTLKSVLKNASRHAYMLLNVSALHPSRPAGQSTPHTRVATPSTRADHPPHNKLAAGVAAPSNARRGAGAARATNAIKHLPAALTQTPPQANRKTDLCHHNQKDLQMPSIIEPTSTLSQLDRQLRELTREHGHVLRLDEFRRHLDEHKQALMARHVPPPPPPRAQPDPEAAGETDRMRQLQAEIATRLQRGDTLDTVERELIAPSGLPEEQQSALWLDTWSHPKRPALGQREPRLAVWAALRNALLTLVGIYRY